MKIALIADAHANLPAAEAVLRDITLQGVGHIVFAGDAVGYYPYVNEVCSLIKNHADTAVKGNHEAFVSGGLEVSEQKKAAYALDYTLAAISEENMIWISTLPDSAEIVLQGRMIRVYHGSPWDHLGEYVYPDCTSLDRFSLIEADFIILGHTHYPMVKSVGDIIIINPGSCGQPRDHDPRASYALLDTESRQAEIRRVDYDVESVLRLTGELGFAEAARRILTRRREDLTA